MKKEKDCVALLQDKLKKYYAELANYPVYICGEGKSLAEGEKAVWVQFLPERNPYPDHADPDRAGIRALFIYYPMEKDPSLCSEEALCSMGALRVFGYMGIPESTACAAPGMVCTHGGLGHAYATYVLEAIKHGFAAIALDTEGYCNQTGGNIPYSEAEAAYTKDALGHKEKDAFSCVQDAFQEQWLYYAVGDTVLANSVLRADRGVAAESVGVTGISWGGLIVSTTICYDNRFAFCIPVYISFHMAESLGTSVGDLPNRPYAAALWQDRNLLAKSQVFTMILASDRDLFASVDTSSATYHDLQHGSLLIKPNFGHSQQEGASPAEIYYYAKAVLGKNGGFAKAEKQPTAEMGRSFPLSLSVPADYTDFTATLYYRTAPISPYNSNEARPDWQSAPLAVNKEKSVVQVEIPADACIYYISFRGMHAEVASIKANTPNRDAYEKGSLYSSTDLVVLGG